MKRYGEYKDSGIEWIGEIPKEWNVSTLGKVATISTGNTPSKNGSANYYDDEDGVLWIKPDNLNSFYPITKTKEFLNDEGIVLARIVPAFTPLVCCIGTIGKFGYSSKDSAYNQQINAVLFNENKVNWKYGLYTISLLEEPFWFYSNGNVVRILNTENQKRVSIVLPSISEQKNIVSYLDRKTSSIDALIADKQKLVELLQEKRATVISEAVTKGLDKTVKMKDSGIEWIGEIPINWDIRLVSHMATVIRGASPRPAGDARYFNGSAVHWITVAEVTNGDEKYITDTESYLTEEGKSKSRFIKAGTLLLSNSGATLGVPKITLIDGCINDGSVALLNLDINQIYLYYALKCRTNELRKQMQGYGQPNLNTTIIKNIAFPYPSKADQEAIVFYLDQKTAEIDTLITDINEQIEKLKEYRQAVISEVVTGKVAV